MRRKTIKINPLEEEIDSEEVRHRPSDLNPKTKKRRPKRDGCLGGGGGGGGGADVRVSPLAGESIISAPLLGAEVLSGSPLAGETPIVGPGFCGEPHGKRCKHTDGICDKYPHSKKVKHHCDKCKIAF